MIGSDQIFLFCLFLLNPFFIVFLVAAWEFYTLPYSYFRSDDIWGLFISASFVAVIICWVYHIIYALNPDAFMFIDPEIKWGLIAQLTIFWLFVQVAFVSGLLLLYSIPDILKGIDWSFTGKLTLVFIPSACGTLYFSFTYPYGF